MGEEEEATRESAGETGVDDTMEENDEEEECEGLLVGLDGYEGAGDRLPAGTPSCCSAMD